MIDKVGGGGESETARETKRSTRNARLFIKHKVSKGGNKESRNKENKKERKGNKGNGNELEIKKMRQRS